MSKIRYKYRVRDVKGRIHTGRAVASSVGQLRRALNAKSYTILSVAEEKSLLKRLSLGRVSAKDRSIVYRELSTMLKAGVGITQSIDIVSETPNRKFRQVLREISASLENGFPLSVAMAGHPKTFPVVEIGVIKAGEATGNLVKVLDELANVTTRSAEFTSRVRGAMIYPAFILVVMVIIGSIIMTKVIPPIKAIFESSGSELPLSTTILLALTDAITNYWYYMIGVLILILVGIKLFLMTKPGKNVGSYISLNFPVFGGLNQYVFLARFNRTMSLLVKSGVPIIEAVEILADSTVNVTYKKSLKQLMRALEQGSAISTSLQTNKYFPKMMTQLLFVGQQSGDLAGTTTTLADYYESEVDAKLRSLSALLEPFIIVILGLAVAFVIISVLQPIYNLTGEF